VDEHLRIRVVRLEHIPLPLKLLSQLPMVVDTPIKHHRDQWLLRLDLARDDRGLAGLVGQVGAEVLAVVDHGLGAALVVDDAQSSMDERDIDDGAVVSDCSIAEASLSVGASVFDGFVKNVEPNFRDRFEVRRGSAVFGVMNLDDTSDAAHG
jgi:hypothetical protein